MSATPGCASLSRRYPLHASSALPLRLSFLHSLPPPTSPIFVDHTCSHLRRPALARPPLLGSSSTNRLITSKDHASVQINVGHLDEHGVYTGQFTTFALCGFVRAQGDADSAIDRLWQKKKAEASQ
eukprot:SM000114S24109  [mRNA]  locus=s114:30958:31480:+ [translate_table: standard]